MLSLIQRKPFDFIRTPTLRITHRFLYLLCTKIFIFIIPVLKNSSLIPMGRNSLKTKPVFHKK